MHNPFSSGQNTKNAILSLTSSVITYLKCNSVITEMAEVTFRETPQCKTTRDKGVSLTHPQRHFHSWWASCCFPYLLVCLDNLDDLIVNLPPEQLLSLTAVVNGMEKHQLHTKLPQPKNTHTHTFRIHWFDR